MSEERRTTICTKLTATRQALLSFLQELDESQWASEVYAEDQIWKVADVLRHLVDAERSMTRLVEVINQGGEGASADFDLDRWNARGIAKASDKSPVELMGEMGQNRAYLFQVIASLNPEDWQKRGRHGSMRIMSIEEILNLIADHELRHTEDIRLVTEKQ